MQQPANSLPLGASINQLAVFDSSPGRKFFQLRSRSDSHQRPCAGSLCNVGFASAVVENFAGVANPRKLAYMRKPRLLLSRQIDDIKIWVHSLRLTRRRETFAGCS